MKNEEIELTDVWKQYEIGKNFNRRMDLYEKAEKHYNFYHGNQWENAKLGDMKPITLNVIKPTIKYKVGVVNMNSYQIVFNTNVYEDMEQRKKLEQLCKLLNKYANKMWELGQVNKKVREAIKDSSIDAEGITHSFYNEDDDIIETELVDKTNIYYGNENDSNIQDQPYIIISFRRTVESVIEEAKANGVTEEDLKKILPDEDYFEQSGADKRVQEVSPMCLVLLKYYKKDGTVWFKKCTRTVTISKEKDTGLTLYPIAHMVWEQVKGYARGVGEVEYMIPNQIEINRTATRRSIAVKMAAYPKLVANSKYISNVSALNKIGSAILTNELNADDVSKVVTYLTPASMSSDAYNLQQELMKDTQDLAGAGDTVNGNVDPTQASGKAIVAVQQASQQPLNEQVETAKTFIEDIARIWFNMIQTYKTDGLTLIAEDKDVSTGETIETPVKISSEELQDLKLNIKIDITPKGAYDKYAQELSLENLMMQQKITFEEYVKALPEDSTMPKTKLEEILRQREEVQKAITELEKEANIMNSAMEQAMEEEKLKKEEEMKQDGMSDSDVQEGEMLNEMSRVQNGGDASMES